MNNSRFKRIVSLFAVLLLVMTLVPTQGVLAGAKRKLVLKSGAAVIDPIYVGNSYTLKLLDSNPEDGFTYGTSNRSLATMDKTSGKMKAIAPGQVTIYAYNKSGYVVTSHTFTILQRPKTVTLEPEYYVGVGESFKVKPTLTPATATDSFGFESSDSKTASILPNVGKLTGKAEGTATITVYSKPRKEFDNSHKNNIVVTAVVHVGTFLESASQDSAYTVRASFKSGSPDADVSDFSLVCNDDNQPYTITNVSVVSAEKKVVSITTEELIPAGKSFTLTYKGDTENAVEFTSEGYKISALEFTPAKLSVGISEYVYVTAKGEKNEEIRKINVTDSAALAELGITVTANPTDGCKLIGGKGYSMKNENSKLQLSASCGDVSNSIIITADVTTAISKIKIAEAEEREKLQQAQAKAQAGEYRQGEYSLVICNKAGVELYRNVHHAGDDISSILVEKKDEAMGLAGLSGEKATFKYVYYDTSTENPEPISFDSELMPDHSMKVVIEITEKPHYTLKITGDGGDGVENAYLISSYFVGERIDEVIAEKKQEYFNFVCAEITNGSTDFVISTVFTLEGGTSYTPSPDTNEIYMPESDLNVVFKPESPEK